MAQADRWAAQPPPTWVMMPSCSRGGGKRAREGAAAGDGEPRPRRLKPDSVHAPQPLFAQSGWPAEASSCVKLALRGTSVISCPCGWHGVGGSESFARHAAAAHGLPRYIALKLAPQAAAASRCCLDCDACS